MNERLSPMAYDNAFPETVSRLETRGLPTKAAKPRERTQKAYIECFTDKLRDECVNEDRIRSLADT